jgi:hypothetical protein
LYCYDSSNAFAACSGGSFTSGYVTVGDITGSGANHGDLTGKIAYDLFNAVTDQDQVDISAVVDPSLSLSLDTNTCDLGTLSTGSVSGCLVNATYTSNASGGINIFIENTGPEEGLTDGKGNVITMQDGTCSDGQYTTPKTCADALETWTYPVLAAGTAGAGWSIPGLGGGNGGLPNTNCSDPQYQTQATCEGNTETWNPGSQCPGNGSVQTIGASGAFSPDAGALASANVWSFVGRQFTLPYCFSAAISDVTPAGTYTHDVTFTVTGIF